MWASLGTLLISLSEKTLLAELVRLFLEGLGIDLRQQVLMGALAYLAAFFVYAGFQFRKSKVYSILYLLAGMGLFLILFSDKPQGRIVGATGFAFASVAAFAWHFMGRGATTADGE